MKREIKKKLFVGISVTLLICSLFIFIANNTLGVQDDSDIETTLHCELTTNSAEIHSTLMPTGTYSFWEEPELDVGTMTHDSTRITVFDLQHPTYNETIPKYYSKNDGLTGNFTVNTSRISQYTVSAPFDTTISVNVSYLRNYSDFSSLIGSFDVGALGGNDQPVDVFYDGTYFYLLDYFDDVVYKYPSDFSSLIGSYNIGSLGGNDDPVTIGSDGIYFYITDWVDEKVYKYPSDFSSIIGSYSVADVGGGIAWDGTYWYISRGGTSPYVDKYSSGFGSLVESYNLLSVIGGANSPTYIYWDGTYFYTMCTNKILYKFSSDFSSLIGSFDVGALGGNDNPRGICWDECYYYVVDVSDGYVYKYISGQLIENMYIENFSYRLLGIDYYENITCEYDSSHSYFNSSEAEGSVNYYFDSTMFSQYVYVNDITIPQQNLTLVIDLQISNGEINMTIIVSYSTSEWVVPTQVALTINLEEVTDSTYNRGWISLDTYPSSLIITATENVYFKLNITVDFSFTFNLDIISKTYLKKSFELESNHEIDIERMDFDSNLDILKIYLNNIDKGNSNPCTLSPAVSMDTGNIFTLEIILVEEIYLPLEYIYNHLGAGTSNLYMSGISNTLTYSNINGNHVYQITMPTNWHPEYANLSFSNIDYLPDYTPNYAEDISGYGYNLPSYGLENLNWSQYYYHEYANGTWGGDCGGSGYENVYSEYFNALNGYMSHNYGDMDGYNSTYSVSDYLYMQNIFPTELRYEDWSSWIHTYNSEYISSTWDNTGANLTSVLNTGSDSSVPLNSSFNFVNGSLIQNGSLLEIDGDYSIIKSDILGSSFGSYTGISYNVSAQDASPQNVYWNGTHFLLVGSEHDAIYVYNSSWGYTGISYDISGQDSTPKGICSNGTHYFLLGIYNDEVFEYTLDWTYTGNSYDISGQDIVAQDIAWNGTHYFMIGHVDDSIFVYNLSWGYTGVSYDVSAQDAITAGLYVDEYYFYMVGSEHDTIYVYDLDGTYTGISYNISAQDGTPRGLTNDGNYFYMAGNGNDQVYKYFDNGITELNFTSQFSFTITGRQSNDTIDFMRLYYSYKTNETIQVDFYVWNYDNNNWDLINSSQNKDNFYDLYFTLNSSHYNSSNTIKLMWSANDTTTPLFGLFLDKLMVQVNWTKTSGDIYATITKDIDFSFLDRYDVGYDGYQKLYNVTIEFQYRYTNYTDYIQFAKINYHGNSYSFIKDGSWHSISLSFIFDSDGASDFNILFNITNGLLEIKTNFNYTIFFECIDTLGYSRIYQYFKYDPTFSLDYLQKTRGNFILNFTYSFIASSDLDLYTFYNSFNTSLLNILVYVNDESGWESPVCYQFNTSQLNIGFSFNITGFLEGLGKTRFNDFYIEIYISGNPSNFTMDNLTLWDFDHDFYLVSEMYIDDSLIVSHQGLNIYWKASDRYISHVIINQTYVGVEYNLYNITLINNTLQSQHLDPLLMGLYQLNLTFYDKYGDYEWWLINYTVIAPISISIGYRNPVFTDENNTFYIRFNSEYSITQVYYHNSTDYILQYDNSSYPEYAYEFNFTVKYSVATEYNISVWVTGEYNDTFWVNVTGLSVIMRNTMLDIINLYYSYYQDEHFNVTISLRDIYNAPIQGKTINYTIIDSLDVCIYNSSGITDSSGEINIYFNFNLTCETGFWHLNASFTGNGSYCGVWKLQSFHIRPISRSVNSTDINLKVNGYSVVNNFIQINWTNNLKLTNYNTSTFNMSIIFKLNYTNIISYNQQLSYSNTFYASNYITSITYDTVNITNYPSNFTNYYFNDLDSLTYTIVGNIFSVDQLIGDTYYNNDDFNILFTYMDTSQVERIQLTSIPRTDSNTVCFKEYLTANRTFSYWYFHNSYNISTVSLYHNRTGTSISYSSFTIENSNYYFEKSCSADDLFTATVAYYAEWDISYNVVIDNGTVAILDIEYSASVDIINVTTVIDLTSRNLYAENWSHNGEQDYDTFVLEIPGMNYTTSTQTLKITGISSVPYCTIRSIINEDGFDLSDDDHSPDEYFLAYLDYPKFSKSFIVLDMGQDWDLDGVHYGSTFYDITDVGYFETVGFGTGIYGSYLRFNADPITRWKRETGTTDSGNGFVRYKVTTISDLEDVSFVFYIEDERRYDKKQVKQDIEIEGEYFEVIDLYTLEGQDYYEILNLEVDEGEFEIYIEYEYQDAASYSFILLLIGASVLGFAAIYIGIRNRKKGSFKWVNKFKFWKKKEKEPERK